MSALETALGALVGGRIDAAHLSPATGLIALVVWSPSASSKRLLGVGLGPRVAGVGWLPRLPRTRAPAVQPLVASMRAHLVGRRIAGVRVERGSLELEVEPEGVRIVVWPGRRGQAVVSAGGAVVRWPPSAMPADGPPLEVPDLDAAGAALLEESDRVSIALEHGRLKRAAARATAATRRRVAAIEGDLERVASIELLQRTGRLLLAQGGRIPRGATRAVLDDWETGGSLEVALDPARPAKEQAEAFFAKARRWQRGKAVMERRLAGARASLAELEALAVALAEAPDPDALDALAERARALGVRVADLEASAPRPGHARAAPERLPFARHRGASDREIRVGRGAADNDTLTARHARPGDLWLHAKNVVGAHVVVPLDRGESCPADLLVDAATLAAHYSDARGETVCEVSYVERRYVRKRRGSPPGAVTLDREKVIVLRVEPGRLARLLATREEPAAG